MDTFLTYLGICVAICSPFLVSMLFPKPAKAKVKPKAVYVPHHIDERGDIIMSKKIDRYM